ncbi:MAG: hypothetical protein ACK4N5_08235, partial [Myxococcales bacterium]
MRLAALLLIVLLPASSALAVEKVVVLPLAAGRGVEPALADVVSDAFAAALQARGLEVVTPRDVQNLLQLEREKAVLSVTVAQRLGEEACAADVECLQQLGGALGARYVVTGTLARIGGAVQL